MRQKITFLLVFMFSCVSVFAQEQIQKDKDINDGKRIIRNTNVYEGAVDGVTAKDAIKAEHNYSIPDSPGASEYSSNTYDEVGWIDYSVTDNGLIGSVQISYDWTTDSYPGEGSFHIESPSGTQAIIGSGETDGSYTKTLNDFEFEKLAGDWKIWIQDSYGDGGHQATNITLTVTDTLFKWDAALSGPVVPVPSEEGFLVEDTYDLTFDLANMGDSTITKDSIDWGYVLMDMNTMEGVDTTLNNYEWTGSLETDQSENVTPGQITLDGGNMYGFGGWSYKPNDSTDMNHKNDTAKTSAYVYKPGQVIETFEGGEVPPAQWDADPSGWEAETNNSIDGTSASIWHKSETGTSERKNLYTPKLTLDGSIDHLYFELAGVNNGIGEGSSKLTIKYAESMDGTWNDLVTMDMATEGDAAQTKVVDLSSIPEGDYYFAFSAVTDFYYVDFWGTVYSSAVIIDNVAGPVQASVKDNDLAVSNIDYTPHEFMTVEEDTVEVSATVKNMGLNKQENFDVTLSVDGQSYATTTIDALANNETQEVTFEFSPETAGDPLNLEVSVPDDEDNTNNSSSMNVVSVDNTMNTFGFETGMPTGWSANGWFGATASGDLVFEGSGLAACDGGGSGGPWEDYKLITEKFSTKGSFNKFYFYGRRMHNDPSLDYQSTIEIMYTNELGENANWTKVGETIELTDNYKLHSVDVSSLPDGDYYFAFNASSNYIDSEGNTGMVLMDHVITPAYPGPAAATLTPADEETNVAYDNEISVAFDQEIETTDLSGISIVNSSDEEVTIDSVKKVTSKKLEIFYDTLAIKGETYTVTIPENTVSNGALGNENIQWSFTTTMAAPQPTVFYPDTMAQGIPLNSEVYVKFNQEVTSGFGSVSINSSINGAVAGVSSSLENDKKTLVINHNDFASYEDTITVNIGADVVNNADNVSNTDTSWTFYTMQAGQPVVDSLAPANNEYAVATDATVEIHLSEQVIENDLSGITIEGENSGAVSGVSATLHDDSVITVSHDAFPNNNELYSVTIPEGAVTSVSTGTPNSEIKWNFTTIMAAPVVTEMTPEDGATGVALDYNTLRLEFDQSIDDSQVNLDTVFTVIGESDDTVAINTASINYANDKIIDIMLDENFANNNETYTVSMMADAVHNRDSVFNDAVSWQFTTIMKAPEAVSFTPNDGATDVALDADLAVEFNQDLTVNSLSGVKIESQKMGQVSGVSATLADDNKTVNIAHDKLFTANDDVYTVSIPANSLKNADMIANETEQYSFKTVDTYDITFEVMDEDGALENATVAMGNDTMMTDMNGQVSYEGIVAGTTMDYTIMKEGYETITGSVTADNNKLISYTMTKIYNVTFTVTDGNNPVENAEVSFAGSVNTSDADGKADFTGLEAGSYAYYITKDNYQPKYGSVEISSNMTKTVALSAVSTGINEISDMNIDVYPNPTNGVVNIDNIQGYNEATLKILDMTGKVVHVEELKDVNNTIELEDKSEGLYMMRLELDDKVVNGKLIVK